MRYIAEAIIKNIIMEFFKNLLDHLLRFTTGLGFYGIGLLGIAFGLTFFFGWGAIPAGFVGAFIYKNWESIYNYVSGWLGRIKE